MTNEEMALAIQQGDKILIAPLWEQLRRLIRMYASRYYHKLQDCCAAAGITEEDLLQTGFFAMLDAARAYDPASGYKLTAFLRYPLQNRFNALLGLRTTRTRKDPLNTCDSLDEPIGGEDSDITRSQVIPDKTSSQPFEDVLSSEWRRQLRTVEDEIIGTYLTDSQAAAIKGEFFEGLKLQPIADRLGVTCERVRQLRQTGLRKLRTGTPIRRLRIFLDDEYGALGLSGTGLSAFKHSGSATERAVEVMERQQAQEEYYQLVREERDRLHRYLEERRLARLKAELSGSEEVLNKTHVGENCSS